MRFLYSRVDPDVRALLSLVEGLRKLFDELVLRTGGDVDEALKWMKELQRRGYIAREDLDGHVSFKDMLKEMLAGMGGED